MTEKRYNSLVRHHTKYKLTFFLYKSDHIDKAIQVHVHVLRVEAWDALHFLPIYNFHRSHNSINITWHILYLFQYIVFMSASKEGRTSYFYLFWMWRGMKYWHLYARFPSQLLNQSPDNNIPRGMGKTKQSNIAISIGNTVNQCGVHFMLNRSIREPDDLLRFLFCNDRTVPTLSSV